MKKIVLPLYGVTEIPFIPSPGARLKAIETIADALGDIAHDMRDGRTDATTMTRRLEDVLSTLFTESGISYDPDCNLLDMTGTAPTLHDYTFKGA